MPDSHERVADRGEDLRIGLDRRTREVLPCVCESALHCICSERLTRTLVDGNSDGLVCWISKPARVDGGKLVDAGAVESDCAARKRRDDGAENGCVLEAILGLGSEQVGEVTDVAGCREVLNLWPGGRISVKVSSGLSCDEVTWCFLPSEVVADRIGEWTALEDAVVKSELSANVEKVVCEPGECLDFVAIGGTEENVILHVLSYTTALGNDWNIELVELLSRPNARNHKQLG